MITLNRKETLSVMIYLYNRWNINEAIALFGQNLGKHIFSKWIGMDTLRFLTEIDDECLDKIVAKACEEYIGRTSRKSDAMRKAIKLCLMECKYAKQLDTSSSAEIMHICAKKRGLMSHEDEVSAILSVYEKAFPNATFDDLAFEDIELYINERMAGINLMQDTELFQKM